jgi:uncharacterized protein (DUF58 family)
MSARLLDPAFLAKLEQLSLMARRSASNPFKGEHASSRLGRSVEFSDYRNYSAGDDFRHIDWNAFGRLEKLFLKLFKEETELAVYVLVDGSASMALEPAKFWYARQLAAALAYIGLCNFDRVSVSMLGGRSLGPLRGKPATMGLLAFLEGAPAAGAVDLVASLQQFAVRKHRPGLVMVISDFLQDADVGGALKRLRHQRHEVFALQVMSPAELQPELRGDCQLIDVEDGGAREVTITATLLRTYVETVRSFCQSLHEVCSRAGIGYVLASCDRPLEDVVLRLLRRERLLE